MLPNRHPKIGWWLLAVFAVPTLLVLLAGRVHPGTGGLFGGSPAAPAPRSGVSTFLAPADHGGVTTWENSDLTDVTPEVIDPNLIQPLPPDVLEYLMESGARNASAELSEFTDAIVSQHMEVTPVWLRETRVMEFWIDPDASGQFILDAAANAGIAASEVSVRHRAFPLAELEHAQAEVWREGVLGEQVNMTSIRYDGTGINVTLAALPEGVPDPRPEASSGTAAPSNTYPASGTAAASGTETLPDTPITHVGNIPIYLDPVFGVGALVPLPRTIPALPPLSMSVGVSDVITLLTSET